VVVHVQLRPRRGATRKCLTALAALAAEHDWPILRVVSTGGRRRPSLRRFVGYD
jgi:hypothetical protein